MAERNATHRRNADARPKHTASSWQQTDTGEWVGDDPLARALEPRMLFDGAAAAGAATAVGAAGDGSGGVTAKPAPDGDDGASDVGSKKALDKDAKSDPNGDKLAEARRSDAQEGSAERHPESGWLAARV